MKLRLMLGVILLLAVGIWLLEDLGAEDGESFRDPSYPSYEVNLSQIQAEKLKAAALQDPTVREIVGEGKVSVASVIPWTEEGGVKLAGAVVELTVAPAVKLIDARLPVLVTPGPTAPEGTPNLHRTAVLSASNVSRLETQVELSSEQVVQVIPGGSKVKATAVRLLGPPVGSEYEGKAD